MPAYVVDDGDSFGRVTDITQGSLKEAITNYIQTYTDYHLTTLMKIQQEKKSYRWLANTNIKLRLLKKIIQLSMMIYVPVNLVMELVSEHCMKYWKEKASM